MFVYLIRNSTNGKCYIGQTTKPCVDMRLHQHRYAARWKANSRPLTCAINKYGWCNFTVHVLEVCYDMNSLNASEIYWISRYNSISPNGYNIDHGGKNLPRSAETRRKISEGLIGRVVSDETRALWSEQRTGRSHTDETRELMKIANRGSGRAPSSKCKITLEIAKAIREEYAKGGITQKLLGEKYGVSKANICDIINRKLWNY